MPLLSILVGVVCGLVVWVALDPIQTEALEDIFRSESKGQLYGHSRESLNRFDHYLDYYESTAHLLANQRNLVEYFDSPEWLETQGEPLRVHRQPPPEWLPDPSFWVPLIGPSHVILFDQDGQARQAYQLRNKACPAELLERSDLYISESEANVYLTALESKPYVILTEPVREGFGSRVGSLMLVVPIDDDFLSASQQGVFQSGMVVAMIDGAGQQILASSAPSALPDGTRLDDWRDEYLITSQSFFDYQGSDWNMEFATFVPLAGVTATTRKILALERRQRIVAAVVFIGAFTLVFFLVSARLNFVLRRLSRFSQRALGFERPAVRGGNQLILLEDGISRFIGLVVAAREQMRSQHESEMRETETLKSAIMDTARDCIVTIEITGEIIEFNTTAERTFGYHRDEMIGCSLLPALLAKPYRDRFVDMLEACQHPGVKSLSDSSAEMVALCADGSELPVEVDLVPIHLESRSVCAVYLHDISRRKRAEQEIGNLARFASESPTPILRVGRRGVILYANVASEPLLRYWGVGRGQTLPLYWCNLVFETLAGRVHTEREITSGTRIYSLLLAPVVDLDYVNIYGRDITEVRLAEQQARRHQAELVHVCRLSTMGEMSTGMAHELNQPLAAIVNFARGSTRRLQAGIGGEKAIMEALEQISIQAERAAEIIRRLRNLVTRQPPVRSTVNMNDLVREVCSFVEYEARKLGIEIQLQLSREDLPVRVDLVQIEQVMLNLIRNAMDALQEVPMKRRALAIETAAHGSDSVRVAVKDSGSGIAAADMRQLFDPFFTTKSSGMGMGLPISKTIIDDHGGTISARSLAGQGTEFTVILPTYLQLADMKERLGTG